MYPEQKNKAEKIISRETKRDRGAEESVPEKIQEDVLQKAEKIKARIEERYFELTGQKKEVRVDDLYRDLLRKMMLNVGLLSSEMHEALAEEYQKKGAVIPLFELKNMEYGEVEAEKKYLQAIPETAVGFEDIGMLFIKYYGEENQIVGSVLFEQLAGLASDLALEKKRSEGESVIQKEAKTSGEVTQDKFKTAHDKKKDATFAKMMTQKKESYIAKRGQFTENSFFGEEKGLHDLEKMLESFAHEPIVSADLRNVREQYGKMYLDANELLAAQSPEIILKKAELLGLNY